MVLAALTFALTLGLVVASHWLLVVRPERRAAAHLRARLQVKAAAPAPSSSLLKPGGLELAYAGSFIWYRRFVLAPAAALSEKAGIRMRPSRLIAATLLGAVVVACVLVLADMGPGVAVVGGLLTPLAPYAYLRNAAQRRLGAFEEAFPEAIDLMARALRAGHALTATLGMIAEEVTEPVRSEFRLLYEQHNYGLPLPQVLKAFAIRMPLTDVRLFVTAVLTQRETGGNLAEILDNLATVTRDRFRVRRQLRVLTAQGRMTGWILTLFPVLLSLMLWALNPAHINAFLADPVGVHMLQAAAVLQVVGTVLIRKILSVDY